MSNDPRAAAPQPDIEAEDPLVELARLVSGGDQFAPSEPVYQDDPAGDLEAELLAELGGPGAFDGDYGQEQFAAAYPDLAAAEAYPVADPMAGEMTGDLGGFSQAEMDAAAALDAEALEADLSAGFAQEFEAGAFDVEPVVADMSAPDTGAPAAMSAPELGAPDVAGMAAEMDFDAAFQSELDAQLGAMDVPVEAELTPTHDQAQPSVQAPPPAYAAPLEPVFDAGYGQPNDGLPAETMVQPSAVEAPARAAEPAMEADLGAFPPAYEVQPEMYEQNQPGVAPVGAAIGGAAAAATLGAPHVEGAPKGDESNRNKYLLAAGFGGLLLIGGLAVFGFNSGGNTVVADASEATLVSADEDPVMVKPDDPGGVQIPNQDKAVYDRVNGGDNSGEPQQTALVEGAETPVAIDRVAAAKSDDRLTDTPAPATGGNSLLAPRRVQTVVVKPDGTIVSVQPEAPAQQVASVQPDATASATPVVSAEPQTPVLDGATLSTGTIPLPRSAPAGVQIDQPTQVARVEFTPPAATRQVQSQPVVRPAAPAVQPATSAPAANANAPLQLATPSRPAAAPAAAPVAQPTTSGGGFVVQVSSQRSADAARASYANLQRRFGSILGGRGADIRQANVPDRGVFYRVRVPAGSRSDANSLCERLKAAGGSCFVTR